MKEHFATFVLDDLQLTFYTRDQLKKWWIAERIKWEWLWAGGAVERRFFPARDTATGIDQQLEGEVSGDIIAGAIVEFLSGKPGYPVHSSSLRGQRWLNAATAAGHEAASILVLVESGHPQGQNVLQQPSYLVLFCRAASASYAAFPDDREALLAERRNYRHGIARLEDRVHKLEAEKDWYERRRLRRTRRLARFVMGRSQHLWSEAAEQFETKRDEALRSIADTEDKYRVQMALQAPVDYWNVKSREHGKWEISWAIGMAAYFLIAAIAIYFVATEAANYLLRVPEGANSTPIYIIISGATLGATTLIFWIGRLIVKLYLSEHHMKVESREKAVMTQAFLSMETRETFSEAERGIVLASIFRNSPDGIVKDEGPGDIGVQAVIARLLSPRT